MAHEEAAWHCCGKILAVSCDDTFTYEGVCPICDRLPVKTVFDDPADLTDFAEAMAEDE